MDWPYSPFFSGYPIIVYWKLNTFKNIMFQFWKSASRIITDPAVCYCCCLQNQSRKITKVCIFVIRSSWCLCLGHSVVCQWQDDSEPVKLSSLYQGLLHVAGVYLLCCPTACNRLSLPFCLHRASGSAPSENFGPSQVFPGHVQSLVNSQKPGFWSFSKSLVDISLSGFSCSIFCSVTCCP